MKKIIQNRKFSALNYVIWFGILIVILGFIYLWHHSKKLQYDNSQIVNIKIVEHFTNVYGTEDDIYTIDKQINTLYGVKAGDKLLFYADNENLYLKVVEITNDTITFEPCEFLINNAMTNSGTVTFNRNEKISFEEYGVTDAIIEYELQIIP